MHRLARLLVGLVIVAAGMLTFSVGASAGILDGRSPDTRDVAAATAPVGDHRSPDTIDAVAHGAVTTQPAELRSPDTRDAPIVVPSMPRATVVVRETPAFDWADAGIGAAGGFAIALLLGGIVLLSQRGNDRKLAL